VPSNNTKAFLGLVRAGLWEKEARLSLFDSIDFDKVYRLAKEQSVIGLVLSGLEYSDVKPPQELLLQWIGEAQLIEKRNKAMNGFVAELIDNLRKKDIYALLIKGQGIAQCYEKPLLRACGDIDLLLSSDNYEKAKVLLLPLASAVDKEDIERMHLGMTIVPWLVELHGALPFGLSSRVDKVINDACNDVFYIIKKIK